MMVNMKRSVKVAGILLFTKQKSQFAGLHGKILDPLDTAPELKVDAPREIAAQEMREMDFSKLVSELLREFLGRRVQK
jgi:hypothetical protein